ncbi:MAG TPA: TIM barrel protein [Acidimicrobiales bacterium]|nr:TIM barrel protein [Acidimicrobiales bacterium]
MTTKRPLGIVSVAFGLDCPLPEAARRAQSLGFDHLDIAIDRMADAEEPLALAVGDRNGPVPQTGCTCRLRPGWTWDQCVALLRRQPELRVEPGPRSVLDNAAAIRAMCQEVPGLRITMDTGWAAFGGYDPLEVADLAGHVQLRQARPGHAQVHPDEEGDVDFAAVIDGLEALDYRGLFSVEYFDLPELGLPLADPVGHCVDLADRVRPLLAAG